MVKCNTKEKWQIFKQDSLNLEDNFLYAVNKFKLRDSSGTKIQIAKDLVHDDGISDNISNTSNQKQRIKKIEQLIEENASS